MADHDTHDHTGIPGIPTGAVATDSIWTTAGKAAIATGTGTATQQWPPGHEFDYAQATSAVNITATTEATANTIVTGAAVTYSGSDIVMVEFFSPSARPDSTAAAAILILWLYDGSSSIGRIGTLTTPAANTDNKPVRCSYRITPSAAAHTYSVRGSVSGGTGVVSCGAGGAGNLVPMFLRIIKV